MSNEFILHLNQSDQHQAIACFLPVPLTVVTRWCSNTETLMGTNKSIAVPSTHKLMTDESAVPHQHNS